MNPSDQKKKRYKPAERVSLTPANVELLDQLLRQVRESLPELKLGRNDLVNWLLKTHGDTLTDKEIAEIQKDHFDPIRALEAVIVQARKTHLNGDPVNVEELLMNTVLKKRRKRVQRAKNADSAKE